MCKKYWSSSKELMKDGIRYNFNYSTYDEDEFNQIDSIVQEFLKKKEETNQKWDSSDLERRHWITHTTNNEEDRGDEYYECSNCHTIHSWYYPFCPSCGSLMKRQVIFEWIDPEVENKERRLRITQWRPIYESMDFLKENFIHIVGVEFDEKSCSIYCINDLAE